MFIKSKYFRFNLLEWHHLYLGILIIGVGVYLQSITVWVIGVYVALDDFLQHICQGSKMCGNQYMSPLAAFAWKLGFYDNFLWRWLKDISFFQSKK